ETWDELFNVNVRAMFYLTHLIVPKMIAAKRGDIVNIGSTAGLRGFAGGTAYSASKFAVHGFTEALQKDLRRYGIRVTGIIPANVDNDLMGENPPPDTYLTPGDIGSAVVYAVTLPPHASVHHMLMVGMAEDW
ncbi:MAG TPA: SDR family NAD(P)-dependent oxidoreductase, partial [Oceanobacillus sp.]|nr:SDR family NAD(P)-dependent oxidoreductase [Oceanobacillus sp.]